jgi:hypothetical protein
MSCETDPTPIVTREAEIPAPPDRVWKELPGVLDDDGRVRVVEHEDAPWHLSFWWTEPTGDEPASHVDVDLSHSAVGTFIRIRETRLDGSSLVRSATHARARV